MSYQVEVLPEAAEATRRLDTIISRRILLRLKWLSINFESIQHQRLTGKLRAIYKLRVGDYRPSVFCEPYGKAFYCSPRWSPS